MKFKEINIRKKAHNENLEKKLLYMTCMQERKKKKYFTYTHTQINLI